MRFDVLTLFPDLIWQYCQTSILGIALEKKLYDLSVWNPRDYSSDKHKRVDDTPYGGGAGMVLSPQPYIDCLEAVLKENSISEPTIIITSPSGQKLDQKLVLDLSQKKQIIILCGRYEGFDQRIKEKANLEISIGDYVLSGGELAGLTIIDSVLRNIPGVLGDSSSTEVESFSEINLNKEFEKYKLSKKEIKELIEKFNLGTKQLEKISLLEFPQYTRPAEYKGLKVPSILESGDHKAIFIWRLEQSLQLTKNKRPDLIN